MDNVREAVQLSNALWWNLDLRPQRLVDVHELRNTVALDDNFLEFTGEHSLNLIKKRLAMWCEGFRQLRELHILAASGPEEVLLGEVLLTHVSDADRDVVVREAAWRKM